MLVSMKNGFTQIPNKVLLSNKLNSCEKLVLCVIKMHIMDNKDCFPSRPLIAEESGFYVRTVDKAIKGLVKHRFVKVKKRHGKSNLYKLNF